MSNVIGYTLVRAGGATRARAGKTGNELQWRYLSPDSKQVYLWAGYNDAAWWNDKAWNLSFTDKHDGDWLLRLDAKDGQILTYRKQH